MKTDTNLHIEVFQGKFYLYDKIGGGMSVCYGVFSSEMEAEKELKRYLKMEKSQSKKEAA